VAWIEVGGANRQIVPETLGRLLLSIHYQGMQVNTHETLERDPAKHTWALQGQHHAHANTKQLCGMRAQHKGALLLLPPPPSPPLPTPILSMQQPHTHPMLK